MLPDSIKGVVNVSLIAENVCGEMTELDRQPLDVEASGTGRHCTVPKMELTWCNHCGYELD